ncbi:MAG: ORF6N domain-containing protein [Bacteroidales bacterium]|nr:ORF6N domain-containing protein [Bacteroidales bacterium]
MNELINFNDVNTKIITIRNQNVILDSAVAELYGVETKRVNEAIKNNPDKFPNGYIFEVSNQELVDLRSKFSTANLEMTRALPKAFTEKGLYMLATILKSPQATQTTIAIVETFAKLKQLSDNIIALNSMDVEVIEPEIIESTGGLLSELLFSGLPTSAETSLELNLGLMKLKRTVKSEDETIKQELSEIKKMLEKLSNK